MEDLQEVLASYSLNPFDHVQINQGELEEEGMGKTDSPLYPDKHLWNVLLFAIWYDQTDVVSFLLSDAYKDQIDPLSIRQPPKNNQEYHLMGKEKKNKMDKKAGNEIGSLLGIRLAIKNQNLQVFSTLLETFAQSFNITDLCEVVKTLIGEQGQKDCCRWQEGMQAFLKS